jgi:hypothetical protein
MIPIIPDTPSSVLQLLNADKSALEKFANTIIQDVKEGRENPLEIQLLIKKYEYVLNEIKENIKVNVTTETAKYGDKEFEYSGAKCHYTPTATSYDFSVCNDSQWNALQIESIMNRKKMVEREAFLKSLTDTITIINDETGEMETISPPQKKQTYGLKVTLK